MMKIPSLLLAVLATLTNSAAMSAPDPIVVGMTLPQPRLHEGQPLAWEFHLSQPTPAEGLQMRIALTEDSDPTPGDVAYNVAGGQGIADFVLVRRPDGTIEGMQLRLAGGVTEARMMAGVVRDGVSEGPETAVWTLLAGDGYQVDSEHSRIEYVLLDAE